MGESFTITYVTEPISAVSLPKHRDSCYKNCITYLIKRKIHVYVGRTEHVHNVQQNGGWCSYTSECVRNNVTSKKMQKNIIYHADACMKGRRSCSQERILPCLLFVCVCVKQFLYTHTHCSFWTKHIIFLFHFGWWTYFFILLANCNVFEYSHWRDLALV